MDELALKLFALLKEISLCCQDREVIQAKTFGLTPAEARCLIVLKLNDIRTTADLAEKLFVAKSRITRILDGMVKKGLVTRSEGLEDRRDADDIWHGGRDLQSVGAEAACHGGNRRGYGDRLCEQYRLVYSGQPDRAGRGV